MAPDPNKKGFEFFVEILYYEDEEPASELVSIGYNIPCICRTTQKPNAEFNRETISPIPSEQAKQDGEKARRDSQMIERAGGQPELSSNAVPGSDQAQRERMGKPKSGDKDQNLLDAGTSFGGDGSAEGGINADEGKEPKAYRSKL